MKRKYLVLAKQNITVLLWAIKTAFHINPLILIFWLLFSGLLALLPSAALFYNRRAVAALSAFLSSGKGDFAEIAMPIILLGIILTVNGLSNRINGNFLYMEMYDRYYFGMQEYMMDSIRKVDMKTLLDKEFYDDYQYCLYRSGGLTDLLSHGCITVMKSVTVLSLIASSFRVSPPIGSVAVLYFLLSLLLNIRFSSRLVIDNIKHRTLVAESGPFTSGLRNNFSCLLVDFLYPPLNPCKTHALPKYWRKLSLHCLRNLKDHLILLSHRLVKRGQNRLLQRLLVQCWRVMAVFRSVVQSADTAPYNPFSAVFNPGAATIQRSAFPTDQAL